MGGGVSRTRINYTKVSSNSKGKSHSQQELSNFDSSSRKRVFISFHIEDEAQVNLLRHQAKDPRFDLEFIDYSVKEPFDEKWKTQCTERIRQSSILVVMIGRETYKREAVLWEINKAYELGKKVIGVRISKDRNDPLPEPMREHKAKIIYWSLEDIQKEINKR